MYRGSPPDPRPVARRERQVVRRVQQTDPWLTEQAGLERGVTNSDQLHADTSPVILPRQPPHAARQHRTRSHSFHSSAGSQEGHNELNSRFEFFNCFHGNHCQNVYSEMWKRQELCDVTLVVQGRKFPAHRVILAANSPYFRAMFTSGLSESQQSSIELNDISSAILEPLLGYFYTSHVLLEAEQVQDLVQVVDMLQVDQLKEACVEYLLHHVTVTNCLTMLNFADIHNCEKLYEESQKLVTKQFKEISVSKEFKMLSSSQLFQLLSLDALSVSKEEVAFEAVISWVKHNPEKRKIHMRDLLGQVRLPLIEMEYFFDHVRSDPLICNDKECLELMLKALEVKCLPNRPPANATMVTPRQNGGSSLQVIAVFGGISRSEPISSVEVYVPALSQWQMIKPMRVARWGSGTAVVNHNVYIAGGSDNSTRLLSVEKFNTQTLQWRASPQMSIPRNGMGLISFKSCLYAIGGFDGQHHLKTVERFSLSSGVWTRVADMNERRYGVGVAVMNGLIYAVGGADTTESELNSVECFNESTNKWTTIKSMKENRKYPGVVESSGRLFVFGGSDGKMTCQTVEIYDPVGDHWVYASPMMSPRSGMGLATLNGLIYIMGGSKGGSSYNSVECYDPLSDRWSSSPSMNIYRDRPCASMLTLPNVDIFQNFQLRETSHIRQYSA